MTGSSRYIWSSLTGWASVLSLRVYVFIRTGRSGRVEVLTELPVYRRVHIVHTHTQKKICYFWSAGAACLVMFFFFFIIILFLSSCSFCPPLYTPAVYICFSVSFSVCARISSAAQGMSHRWLTEVTSPSDLSWLDCRGSGKAWCKLTVWLKTCQANMLLPAQAFTINNAYTV